MTDLTETIAQALQEIASLDAKTNETGAALAAHRHTLEMERQQPLEAVHRAVDRSASLRDSVEALRADSQARAQALETSLKHATIDLETRATRIRAMSEASETRLKALGQKIETVAVEAAKTSDRLRTALDAAAKQTSSATATLVVPLENIERFLGERFIPGVEADRTRIAHRSDEMQHKVRKIMLPRLTDSLRTLLSAIEQTRNRLAASLERSATQARTRSESALQALEQRHERTLTDAIESLENTRRPLNAALEAIRGRIDSHRTTSQAYADRGTPAEKAEDKLVAIPVELRNVLIRARIITPSQIV